MEINGHRLERPLAQGGMGIGISLDRLAGAVAKEGGLGVLSSAYAGLYEPGFWDDPKGISLKALTERIRRARDRAGAHGLIGVNIMRAVSDYKDQVQAALDGGVDAIISGAGLPLELPGLVGKASVLLAPVVSSGRVAKLICRYWYKHAKRLPDFVVVEGPSAGGHLGFKLADLTDSRQPTLADLLADVCKSLAPYEQEAGRRIPIVAAGGLMDSADVSAALQLADIAQLGTRFIGTEECDASPEFKRRLLEAADDDVMLVQSPVGMPGHALKSPLTLAMAEGERRPPAKCYKCLSPCKPAETPYCISRALVAAAQGDWEKGLFFSGSRVGKMKDLWTVADVFEAVLPKEAGV